MHTRLVSLLYLLPVLVVLTTCTAQTSVIKDEKSSSGATKQDNSPQNIELLIKSVKNSDAVTVKRLLSAGVNPNVKDSSGVTPLMIASIRGDQAIAVMLLDVGAEVNATDDIGDTALVNAIRFSEKAIIELLLGRGAELSFKAHTTGYTILHLMADDPEMDTDIVKLLLDRSPNVDVKDNQGETPLKLAAARNNLYFLEALINRGADVNAKSNNGGTPLMSAIGSARAMKLLIEHGADVNAKNSDGWTPLELALLDGCPEIIRLLVRVGARE